MALQKELLNILDDESKPFTNRLKIANNAFRSSELTLQHKEALLIQWALNKIDNTTIKTWELLHEWLKSNQFSELNRNDINNEEISKIVKLIIQKVNYITKEDSAVVHIAMDSILLLIENYTIQQYFKFNIAMFFELVSEILNALDNSALHTFLNKNIFHKNLIASENFTNYFLEILIPQFGKKLLKHGDLFPILSQITQKCIFYNNKKSFSSYMTYFFDGTKDETQLVAKILFKCLIQIYKNKEETSPVLYKLLFHAFSTAYENDFDLIYQLFIIIVQIIGFDLTEKLISFKGSQLKILSDDISFKQSQQILLTILGVLSDTKTNLKCTLKELTFSDFLKNILIEFLHFNNPSPTSYNIFTKILSIEPLVVQSLTEETLCYAMLTDNTDHFKEYNDLIVSIFDTYSRLHRVESLVSKMVEGLNNRLHGLNTKINSMYVFRGAIDVNNSETIMEIQVENILTTEILTCFSKCICQLASWQVINVFKTLLHFFNKVLETIDNTDSENSKHFLFVQILSELIRTFLSTIRIAEHTVATNVVDKCVKCLDDLQNSLKIFGGALVKREYNHQLMWSFLNIAFHWAEMYMTLKYYCSDSTLYQGILDNNTKTSCNISYTHPYLTDREWCLLSERITNFGEMPCKNFLHKLYIQKLRAVYLFEKQFSEDVENNIIRTIVSYSSDNWKEILEDNFIIENLLSKMDAQTITNIADNFVRHLEKMVPLEIPANILNSSVILNAVNAVVLKKINKLVSRQKRKHNEESVQKFLSSKIFATLPDDFFFNESSNEDAVLKVKSLYTTENGVVTGNFDMISEDKICRLLEISKSFPVIFSHSDAQKMFIIYLFSLHKDFKHEFSNGNFSKLQEQLEDLIFGILQWSKFKLSDILDMSKINLYVIQNFKNWEQVFALTSENVFKYENFIEYYGKFVDKVVKNLNDPKFMQCAIIVMNCINKLKKTKMSKDVKNVADSYKSSICKEITELVLQNKPKEHLLLGYAHSLRHYLSQKDQNEKIMQLLKHMDAYVEFALKKSQNFHTAGYLILFITILQNKSQIPEFEETLILKFWNACKENVSVYSRFEEYSQLMVLIVGHVSNEKFPDVIQDMLEISDNSIIAKDFALLGKQLNLWESVISCNLNPFKTKALQKSLEKLLQKLILLIESFDGDKIFYKNVFNFNKTIIQMNQFHLTPALMDLLLIGVNVFMSNENTDFYQIHSLAISLLVCFLKHRKSLILDRLPPYLQHYRNILKNLCEKSNSDINLEENDVRQLADCAHQLEKLTRFLVSFPKDMGRIGMYLIADILEQYEQVTLYPNVKIHLNNCIYSLISICDQHAVNYLMRVLSTASTEIFKLMYDNYKKYYRFTGKV